MDLPQVQKKLAEAQFFLDKMIEEDRQITIVDRKPLDYYLSAFLSAGRTVDYRLCHEQKAIYKPWRKTWNERLTAKDAQLIKFMVDDRNVEVHESGSSRSEAPENVEFPIGTHDTGDSIVTVSGPPGMPPAVVRKPTYNFTIDGTDRKATEACAVYLALLQRMVTDFAADHP